jgi:hypothetical protein
MDRAAQMDPPPALLTLAERLEMSRFERDILLLCAGLDLDTRIAGLCARAQGDPNRAYPTFALAISSRPGGTPCQPPGALLAAGDPPGGRSALTANPLPTDERIVSYLKANYLTTGWRRSVPFDLPGAGAGNLPSQRALVAAVVAPGRNGDRTSPSCNWWAAIRRASSWALAALQSVAVGAAPGAAAAQPPIWEP